MKNRLSIMLCQKIFWLKKINKRWAGKIFQHLLSAEEQRLYIGITTSMSLALSICVLFISLLQSVNEAQLLNRTSLLTWFGLSPACGVFVVVPLTTIYASLKSHKLDFSCEVIN